MLIFLKNVIQKFTISSIHSLFFSGQRLYSFSEFTSCGFALLYGCCEQPKAEGPLCPRWVRGWEENTTESYNTEEAKWIWKL